MKASKGTRPRTLIGGSEVASGDKPADIRVLSRAIEVLFSFTAETPHLTLAELADRTCINKASLLRILRTLERSRLVTRFADEYRLGPAVLHFGNTFIRSLSVPAVAKPHMESLARDCRLPVNLAVLDGMEIVYVAIEQARRDIGVQSDVGGRHPANATALGKVLLAALDDEELSRRLRNAPLTRLTEKTLVDEAELIAHLGEVRRNGYAVDDEERGIGIRCLAAAINDHNGVCTAALSVAGPIFHVTQESIPGLVRRLAETVEAVSSAIGGSANSIHIEG